MKRPNPQSSDLDSPRKRNRDNEETIRLLIPSKIAGAVIGKAGQNINRLRSQYKATVNVDDCQGPERTILISSSLDAVCEVIADILNSFEREQDGDLDVRVLIHQSLAGCVIGKSGSKIKELREKIGSRIKIFSNVAPQSTDRVIQILGTPQHCIASIQEIVSLIKATPIRGPVHLYDPINFDEVFADDYGGYGARGGGGSGGNGGGGGSRSRDNGGRMGERGRDRFDREEERRGGGGGGGGGGGADMPNGRGLNSRSFVDPWSHAPALGAQNGGGADKAGDILNFLPVAAAAAAAAAVAANAGGGGGVGGAPAAGASPLGGGGAGGNGCQDPSVSTTQVTIPKDLAGAIIGKAGGRIRRIRSESSAFITIDEPLPGSSDRIITITGNPKQIQTAQYLLQQSVHENRRRN